MFLKKPFSFSSAILLTAILINILIINVAYSDNPDFYWALLFSMPLLAFAIYYQKLISKKRIRYAVMNSSSDRVYENNNAMLPGSIDGNELSVKFGNSHCAEPYLSGIICIDAGGLNQEGNTLQMKSISSHKNNIPQNLHEETVSTGEYLDDVIWQIKPGYPGCRDHNFNFNRELFNLNASRPSVKMIELTLPLPIKTHNISNKRNTYTDAVIGLKYAGITLKPITMHTAFGTAEGMTIFLDSLRQLSGKKPVGIRMSISDKKEFHEICYAFRKTDIIPDYIVIENDVDVYNLSQFGEICLYEALQFANATLELYGLGKKVKIVAAAEIYSTVDVIKLVTLGADAISIKNKFRNNGVHYNAESNEFYKESRMRFESAITNDIMKIMQAWGYKSIKEITLPVFFRNIESPQLWNFPKAVNNEPLIDQVKPPKRLVNPPQHKRAKRPEVSFS